MNVDNLIFDMSYEEPMVNGSPFIQKSMQYIMDTNTNQNYSTHEVVFETQSLSSNGKWNDWSQAYIVLPIVVTLSGVLNATQTGANTPTQNIGAAAAIGTAVPFNNETAGCSDLAIVLKNSNLNLISSIAVEYGNSSLIQTQQNLNSYLIFKQTSEMSTDYENLNGPTIGYGLDSPAWSYSATAHTGGIGITNNNIGNLGTLGASSKLYGSVFNEGIMKRSVDLFQSTDGTRGRSAIYGTSNDRLRQKGVNFVENTATCKTYQYNAILPLKCLHDFFDKICLLKGASMRIKLNINHAYFEFTKDNVGVITHNSASASFPNGTNPIMVSAGSVNMTENRMAAVPETLNHGIGPRFVPGGSANIPCSCTYRVSLSTVKNMWSQQPCSTDANQTTRLTQCRLYVPTYIMQNSFESNYIQKAQSKIIYRDTIYKLLEEVAVNSDVQFNITTSVVNAKRMIIVPFLARSANANIRPMLSPFASEPSTCSPYLMSNFQVFISSTPLYPQFQQYDFESYISEMSNFGIDGNINSTLCSGRISKEMYENNYGYIVVDLSRKHIEDNTTAVSIDIAFRLDSLLAMDFAVYIETEKSLTVNLLNGSRIV